MPVVARKLKRGGPFRPFSSLSNQCQSDRLPGEGKRPWGTVLLAGVLFSCRDLPLRSRHKIVSSPANSRAAILRHQITGSVPPARGMLHPVRPGRPDCRLTHARQEDVASADTPGAAVSDSVPLVSYSWRFSGFDAPSPQSEATPVLDLGDSMLPPGRCMGAAMGLVSSGRISLLPSCPGLGIKAFRALYSSDGWGPCDSAAAFFLLPWCS